MSIIQKGEIMKLEKNAYLKTGIFLFLGIVILFYEIVSTGLWKTTENYILFFVVALLFWVAGNTFGEHEANKSISDYIDYLKSTRNTELIDEEKFSDPLFSEVTEYVLNLHNLSAPHLQRKFSIGYSRALRLLDQLEDEGYIRKESKGYKVLAKAN